MKNCKIVLIAIILFSFNGLQAQKYFTRSGTINFSSDTPMEKIEAINQKATSVLDASNGKMEFAVLIKAFQFEKALMQEHFNENYMESDQFPKANFKGSIADFSSVDLAKDGHYPVKINGDLTIHGVSQTVATDGEFVVENGKISATSNFQIAVADYGISIPSVVAEKIAKTIDIQVAVDYELYPTKSLSEK